MKQDADRAADALEADRRSEQQYIKIAAAALQVHCALTSLLETFGDSSFLVGLPVLQGVMDSSLTSSPKGASGEKEPNRLAQAAADVRLDLHRAVSLGLGTRNRRLFTIQLSLTFMEHSGLLTHEEAMLLVAICTHHKEPLEAARKALEERQQRDDFEADRLRAMEAGGTPARDPSNGNTLTGGGKTPQSGAGKDKNTGGMPTRATTATPSERPKMAPVHVPPSTAHGGMRGAGGKLGPMIDLTEQPEQLKFIESQSWDTIMQLSQMWQVEE